MDWQEMETAPRDGTQIIGLGYSRRAAKRNGDVPDVRIIKAWSLDKTEIGGWRALNDHSWFTVGFYPDKWMPLPPIPIPC